MCKFEIFFIPNMLRFDSFEFRILDLPISRVPLQFLGKLSISSKSFLILNLG